MAHATLRERLLATMDRKDHWAWPLFDGGGVDRDALLLHFRQEWAVYVRDFPMLLGRVHGRCPVPEVRRALAANLYEEETGGISGLGPHPGLFLRMMEGLGFDVLAFADVALLPQAAAYRALLDRATAEQPWVVGAAVTTIFVEGSRHDRRAVTMPPTPDRDVEEVVRSYRLCRGYGVDPVYLDLVRAHHLVEGGHRRDAWDIVVTHGLDHAAEVADTMQEALERWKAYRDAVAASCGLRRSDERAGAATPASPR